MVVSVIAAVYKIPYNGLHRQLKQKKTPFGRLSQTLCKPPVWCRIEAPYEALYGQKNRIPEENARREKICELLQMEIIGSMEGI